MKLVLVRHGQSVWNLENRFTGWTDVELSQQGIEEAKRAGKLLRDNNFKFRVAYTSVLKRANDTLTYILKEIDEENLEIKYSYKLNERHYGALQGLNKDEIKAKYGEEQFKCWRRGFVDKPPALTKSDDRYPGNDLKYSFLSEDKLPLTECLKDTYLRVVEYYESDIKKSLLEGKDTLIVAHGNSLRALMKYIENISDDDIANVEIPTGKPYVYELSDDLKINNKYYL